MKPQMTKEQFQDWREANDWFFQFLKETVETEAEQLAQIGASVGVCHPDKVHEYAKQANGIMARCTAYIDVTELEYDDIFEQTDEETNV